MPESSKLTIGELKKFWKEEFLPNIREEIKAESTRLTEAVQELTERCAQIENSQTFLSTKYDHFMEALQSTKKQMSEQEATIRRQDETIRRLQDALYEHAVALDETRQYSRRDCLELTGVPIIPNDQPKKLVQEVATAIGVSLEDESISIAHRLPDRSMKGRIIVKFTQRDKRDEIYKRRKQLTGKTTRNLPSINSELGKSLGNPTKIFINESLTPYRKKLFGRIHSFKKENNFKFIWTSNGKIYLTENETAQSHGFTTSEAFEDFLDQRSH